ncbi:hypothetical protein FRB91_001600 [Serendipita sp. 411]|nr:hypothetical protein FRB91_001600 [Serendipita sp. 411]
MAHAGPVQLVTDRPTDTVTPDVDRQVLTCHVIHTLSSAQDSHSRKRNSPGRQSIPSYSTTTTTTDKDIERRVASVVVVPLPTQDGWWRVYGRLIDDAEADAAADADAEGTPTPITGRINAP